MSLGAATSMTLILSSSPGTGPVISNSIMLSSTDDEMCLAASKRTDLRSTLSAILGSLTWRTMTLAPLIAATAALASMPAPCISALQGLGDAGLVHDDPVPHGIGGRRPDGGFDDLPGAGRAARLRLHHLDEAAADVHADDFFFAEDLCESEHVEHPSRNAVRTCGFAKLSVSDYWRGEGKLEGNLQGQTETIVHEPMPTGLGSVRGSRKTGDFACLSAAGVI